MVVCNPDVACPYGDRISAEPGFYAHMLAARGLADVTFLGKPFRGVYDLVGQRFPNVARERMLMVGDSPHTDVLGARGAGMNVLLVECGFLARTGQSRAVPGGRPSAEFHRSNAVTIPISAVKGCIPANHRLTVDEVFDVL